MTATNSDYTEAAALRSLLDRARETTGMAAIDRLDAMIDELCSPDMPNAAYQLGLELIEIANDLREGR